jgi:hypothetical protein
VAGSSDQVNLIQLSCRKQSDKKEETACDCSEIMQLELNNVKLELSSLREILRMLQEEMQEISQSSKPTKDDGNGTCESKESYTLSAHQKWTTLPSYWRGKLPPTNINLRQLPLATS